ncbi:hypothetical protein [Brachybacterium endophyticum]|uniref:PH-like domain-containing protein n=1 Tax=Brachybacterium endophyticum TaxID=2182385 RepID=UPI00196B81A0|nr:hypothetical protein [Brachybacterium endophyticum]
MDLTRYLPPVLALLVLLIVLVLLALWGWRRRAARQGDLPALPQPIGGGKALTGEQGAVGASGVYVATTVAGEPLERVTARGLGARSRAVLGEAEDAGNAVLTVGRQGAPDFLIPWDDVRSVHTAPGMVGKWIGGDGLLVIRWQLGERLLDTGFRPDSAEDQDRFLALGRERRRTDLGGERRPAAPASEDRSDHPATPDASAPTPFTPEARAPQPRKEQP